MSTTRTPPSFWQKRTGLAYSLLRPVATLMSALIAARRFAYRQGWFRQEHLPIPVIVVGNIAVGGSGKTPVVDWLSHQLIAHGWQPGIISRGYGRQVQSGALVDLMQEQAPQYFGDEPVLLAQLTGVPVAVGQDRPQAGYKLLNTHPNINIIISDDGMQHYRLARDLEIAVVDPKTLGNRTLLPAGPLREPLSRLRRTNLVLLHGQDDRTLQTARGQVPTWPMHLTGQDHVVSLHDAHRHRPIRDFQCPVHAIAGIGQPERFFTQLESLGLTVIRHPYPDHYHFTAKDFAAFSEAPKLMTAKDAVKCRTLNLKDAWVFPVKAAIDEAAFQFILTQLKTWTPNSSKSSSAPSVKAN